MNDRTLAWIAAVRPKQWLKNTLVFAAPAGAHVLNQQEPLLQTLGAFGCFCLTASGTYLLNDARDVEVDRLHPTKRYRPIAAGRIPRTSAIAVGIFLVVAGVASGAAIRSELMITLAGYALLTVAYSTVLRNIPVLDILAIASGFVLRAVAGAAAVDVPISDWFFIVTSFGSLFMAVGKRTGESAELADDALAASIRPTLAVYTDSYLAYLRSVSSGVMLIAYCLWAFETSNAAEHNGVFFELSILPFVAAILRYALLIDQGQGATPEHVLLHDRVLQLIGVTWAIVYGIGVYAS